MWGFVSDCLHDLKLKYLHVLFHFISVELHYHMTAL